MASCSKRINFLRAVCGQKWGAHPSVLRILYITTVNTGIWMHRIQHSSQGSLIKIIQDPMEMPQSVPWSHEVYPHINSGSFGWDMSLGIAIQPNNRKISNQGSSTATRPLD
uniref:Uncharacterized protein n=1 Tax=Phlebotomus papatasi TaxID=29031 RepID=A0A1B0DHH4_PHLPP